MQLPAGIEGPDGSTLIKPTAQILKCKSKQARAPFDGASRHFLKSCRYIFCNKL